MKKNRPVILLVSILLISIALISVTGSCAEPAPTTPAPAPTTPAPAPATPAPTPAPEVTELRFYTYAMPTDIYAEGAFQWLDLIEERADGRIEFERLSGGVLGQLPEMLGLIQQGAVDAAVFPAGFFREHFPLQSSVSILVRMPSCREVVDFGNHMYFDNPKTSQLLQQECAQNDIKYLGGQGATTYCIFCKNECSSLAELKNKKIAIFDPKAVFSQLDMVEVKVSTLDMYEAASRGVVDCARCVIGPGVMSAKLYEPCKGVLIERNYPPAPMPFLINLNVFNSLPADIQGIVVEAAKDAQELSIEKSIEAEATAIQIAKDAGANVVDLPEADQIQINKLDAEASIKLGKVEVEKAGKLDEAKLLWEEMIDYLGVDIELP